MRLIKLLDEKLEEFFMVFLLTAMCCVMMLQIIMRYALNDSLTWPEEFSRYCFIVFSISGISYSIRSGSIIRLDIVLNLLPKAVKWTVDLLVQLLSLVFFAYVAFQSLPVVSRVFDSGQTSPALGFPMYVLYIFLSAGMILSTIRSVQSITAFVTKRIRTEKPEDKE